MNAFEEGLNGDILDTPDAIVEEAAVNTPENRDRQDQDWD